MTILDTFYLVIKGDTSDLKVKNQELERETENLSKSLGKMDKTAAKAGETFLGLAQRVTGLLAAYYSFDAVVGVFKRSLDYAIQLDQASRALNVNVESLDAWGNAVRRTGGTAEGFQASLKGLASHLGTTNNIALKVLPRLANTFQRLGNFRAMNYGKMLGLDEPTILLLQKGRREVDAIIQRQKELGVVTKKQAEIARQFKFALDDTGHAFRSLALTVGETVTPIFTRFLGVMTDLALYFRQHKDFVIGALVAIGIAAAGAAVSFGILSSPVLIATAAVAAFAAAYDDIATYLRGGDSALGYAVEHWKAFRNVIHSVGKALFEIRQAFDWFQKTNAEGGIIRVVPHHGEFNGLNPAQSFINSASAAMPLNSLTIQGLVNRQQAQTTPNITIGDVIVNTQASSPDGVGDAVRKTLQEHLWQTNNQYANGWAMG